MGPNLPVKSPQAYSWAQQEKGSNTFSVLTLYEEQHWDNIEVDRAVYKA